MDKVYINVKELDVYDILRIKNIEEEFGLKLNDNLSVEQLLRLLEIIYNEYKKISNEYESLADDIYK